MLTFNKKEKNKASFFSSMHTTFNASADSLSQVNGIVVGSTDNMWHRPWLDITHAMPGRSGRPSAGSVTVEVSVKSPALESTL